MEDKKIPLRLKMWLSAVLGSLLVFFIVKLIWSDLPAAFLIVFLVVGYLLNFFVVMIIQYRRE